MKARSSVAMGATTTWRVRSPSRRPCASTTSRPHRQSGSPRMMRARSAGFYIQTVFSWPKKDGQVQVTNAKFVCAETSLLALQYANSAEISRLNQGLEAPKRSDCLRLPPRSSEVRLLGEIRRRRQRHGGPARRGQAGSHCPDCPGQKNACCSASKSRSSMSPRQLRRFSMRCCVESKWFSSWKKARSSVNRYPRGTTVAPSWPTRQRKAAPACSRA